MQTEPTRAPSTVHSFAVTQPQTAESSSLIQNSNRQQGRRIPDPTREVLYTSHDPCPCWCLRCCGLNAILATHLIVNVAISAYLLVLVLLKESRGCPKVKVWGICASSLGLFGCVLFLLHVLMNSKLGGGAWGMFSSSRRGWNAMALLSAVRCLSVMATVGVCLWGLTVTMTGAGRGGELSWQWAQPTGCDSNLYWYSVAFASFVTAWHVLYSAFLCSCCCTTILALMFPSSGYTQMDDLERQQQADGPQQEIVA